MSKEKDSVKNVDLDKLKAENSQFDDAEIFESPVDRQQKKRNPFIKDPAAYAAYRNRRVKNRLL
ncbi:MAG TPA: hypothetical protein PKC21_03660 [Oligoflexia bacterium]|nr:hypothetical protein [Oligoflexia bacterium]HMR24433.1 hypothetical protein [Oligoflexia bacterium]